MMTRIPGTPFLLATLVVQLALPLGNARACTTFMKEDGGAKLFCKSYDWDQSEGLVMVNKRGVAKTSLLMDLADENAVWTSKYASISFNQYGREMPQGGMNEAGLGIEVMVLGQTQYPPKDDRPVVNELQLVQYCLDNFATIAELAAGLPEIRPTKVQASLHYLACDATGACAAIEYIEGELVLTTGEGLQVNTLTNSTFAASVEYLGLFVGFGGELPIPESPGSLDRFVRASALALQEAELPEPDEVFSILAAVSQGDYSKWNIAYDLTVGRMYWRTLTNAKIKWVDLAHFDLDCTSPVMLLDIDADLEGDVADAFEPYTMEANKTLLQVTLGGMPGVSEMIIEIVAGYPDSQVCTLEEVVPEPMPEAPDADVVSPGPDLIDLETVMPDLTIAPDSEATPDVPAEAIPQNAGVDSVEPAPGKSSDSGCQTGTGGTPLASLLLLTALALALVSRRSRSMLRN